MASLGNHFSPDVSKAKSDAAAIKKGHNYRITVLTERLVRIEYSDKGLFNDNLTDLVANRNFEVPKFKAEEDDKYLVISTKYFSLQYMKEKTFKGPSFAPDMNLKVKLLNTDKVWYYSHPEARRFNASSFSLDDYNGGNKSLDKGLYSTDGFVTLDDSKSLNIDEIGIINKTDDNHIDLYLFMYKRDFGLCLKDYFTLTGYPLLIPRYALGIWWFRDRIYSFEDTKKLIDVFKYHDIPINVLMLGEFWHEKDLHNINLFKTGFTFNKELFPNPLEFTNDMHQKNVYVGINIDPTEGIRKEEECYGQVAAEMDEKVGDTIAFNAFNKMFMISYFENIINKLNSYNIDFYWIDYKKDKLSLRALDYYHIKNYEMDINKRPMLLTRNTNIASHKNGVLYSGETVVSWKTLKYLPFYNSCAANIGLSWWSHDVGGYKGGTEDAELYIRYVQFACFSPIFRFSAKRGLYYKREPWLWDFKTYNIVKNFTHLRQRLIPYIYSEAYNYYKNGIPLIEPLYYTQPEIYDEIQYRNEYFFGKELLIAPITSTKDPIMNRTVQRIFLPKGIWYDFRSGKKFALNRRYVTFYTDDDYPVFAKAGAIIPMANIEDEFNLITNPKKMDIHIFPGESNNYTLYEDDGITRLHEQGYFVKTFIEYTYEENQYKVVIRPVEGKTNIIPDKRDYKIIFRNTKDVDSIKISINNSSVSENSYICDAQGNNFTVTVKDVLTSGQLVVVCSGKNIAVDISRIVNDDINLIINDLNIATDLKEKLAKICFSSLEIKKKRIAIKKLKKKGLDSQFIRMFMKLYDYLVEI